MDQRIEAAMQAKAAAQQALEQADQELKAAAKAKLDEARELCRMAGVSVCETRGTVSPGFVRSDEARQKMAEASRRRWAMKAPEERAAWVAAINSKRNGTSAVQ